MTTPGYTRFDAADYLDNDELMAEYLAASVEDSDPSVSLAALADVAKAKGMSDTDLYKALAPTANRKAMS